MSCCPPCHLEDGPFSTRDHLNEAIPSDGSTMSLSQHEQDYALGSSPVPSKAVMLTELWLIPISEGHLVNDVQRIYSELVKVEKRCIELDKQWLKCEVELSSVLHCHQKLLAMYLDFFLAAQLLSGGTILKSLAEKYGMPSRMWQFGIYSLLTTLKDKRPQSLDYVWTFIYFAYPSLTFLLENVSVFRETWMEFLGGLAQFGMHFEDSEMDRKVWTGIARDWYSQVVDQSPKSGEILFNLAVIAWPNLLQHLFFNMKALVSVVPFLPAREAITLLFNRLEKAAIHQDETTTAFIASEEVPNEIQAEHTIGHASGLFSTKISSMVMS